MKYVKNIPVLTEIFKGKRIFCTVLLKIYCTYTYILYIYVVNHKTVALVGPSASWFVGYSKQ